MICAKDIMEKAKLIPYFLAKKLNRVTIKQSKESVCLSVSSLIFNYSLKDILVVLKKYRNYGHQAKANMYRIYILNLELISIIRF